MRAYRKYLPCQFDSQTQRKRSLFGPGQNCLNVTAHKKAWPVRSFSLTRLYLLCNQMTTAAERGQLDFVLRPLRHDGLQLVNGELKRNGHLPVFSFVLLSSFGSSLFIFAHLLSENSETSLAGGCFPQRVLLLIPHQLGALAVCLFCCMLTLSRLDLE